MINIELLNKDPDVVPEQVPPSIVDIKLAIYMDNNFKDTKHTRHIARRTHFVRNGEECYFQKTVWCEGGLQLADIVTSNNSEDGLNHILGYAMILQDNLQNTCQIRVTGYRRV